MFQGKYDEAKRLYERCQAIYEKVLGPEHPYFAQMLHNWAIMLQDQVRTDTEPSSAVHVSTTLRAADY